MRRWLKENNLSAGSGAPLHDIAAIEDLQRALAAFSGTIGIHTQTDTHMNEKADIYRTINCFYFV